MHSAHAQSVRPLQPPHVCKAQVAVAMHAVAIVAVDVVVMKALLPQRQPQLL
jgi:hypothetical protein